jgi:hypothetical protein
LGADRPPIEPGDGDDGRFFYRLAVAPADLGPEANGVPCRPACCCPPAG